MSRAPRHLCPRSLAHTRFPLSERDAKSSLAFLARSLARSLSLSLLFPVPQSDSYDSCDAGGWFCSYGEVYHEQDCSDDTCGDCDSTYGWDTYQNYWMGSSFGCFSMDSGASYISRRGSRSGRQIVAPGGTRA